ncbi:hypothetical protein LC048_13750 [Mesobacillus subterraneus]|uniref:hypothetical protein n=1 Tax=Mesobacillus subterraneus TaxID=285983 RepID=UPI001CFC4719|nr:hypothetical protein [Mesobacillus subterraneus]WLR53587.1 hypothetical protein LC048_13750 [Mesobacillus subterraneus]
MIKVEIWTTEGECYPQNAKMSLKDIQKFVELIKKYKVFIDGEFHEFSYATYHPQDEVFEIAVK